MRYFNKGTGKTNHNGQNLKDMTAPESHGVRTVAGTLAIFFSFSDPHPSLHV